MMIEQNRRDTEKGNKTTAGVIEAWKEVMEIREPITNTSGRTVNINNIVY